MYMYTASAIGARFSHKPWVVFFIFGLPAEKQPNKKHVQEFLIAGTTVHSKSHHFPLFLGGSVRLRGVKRCQ